MDAAPFIDLDYWAREKEIEYPIYAFFLHTVEDKDVEAYLSHRGEWLDSLTGKDCLISLLERPSKWDQDWLDAWEERLDNGFDEQFAEWEKLTNFKRNVKVKTIADRLNIPMNHMLYMIFIEDLNFTEILDNPFIANKRDFDAYFKDIITCIQFATKSPKGDRLNTMRSKWIKYWVKWIGTQKVKDYATAFKKWGSIVITTKDTLINIFDILSPLIKGLKTAAW